jgi:putative autotransporter adhesin-like protein
MTVAPTSVHSGSRRHWSRWVVVAILCCLLGGLTIALLDRLGGSSESTTEGSGVPATQVRTVPAFTGLELAGSNNVVVRVGEQQSVFVRADDNLVDRITTDVRSGKLVVANTSGSFATKSATVVLVRVPTLDALTLSGSGNVVVSGIDAERLTVSLPGSGTLTGSGTARGLDVTVSGSGTVQFARLVANDARALVSGSGSIFVTATQTLDASVTGSGAIVYAGHPQEVTKSVTGNGAITGG